MALRKSADISKCCTETQPKTPKNKQCRCRSTVAKNSLERSEPRKKPGYEGWPVLYWLCRVEIINLERNQAMCGGQSSSGCARWRL